MLDDGHPPTPIDRPKVHIDLETFSEANLKEVGAHRYSEHPSTEILLIGFAINEAPSVVVEISHESTLAGELSPSEEEELAPLFKAIEECAHVALNIVDSDHEDLPYVFAAHNYLFERNMWKNVAVKKLGLPPIPHNSWDCTMARARAMGLPGSLDGAAQAMKIPVRKDTRGKRLIQRYTKPFGAKKIRYFLADNPEDRQAFMEYCGLDVDVERLLDKSLDPLLPFEEEIFKLDGKINDAGIPVNVELLDKAQELVKEMTAEYEKEAIAISGYKATQNVRILEWLEDEGIKLPNLQAATVEKTIARTDLPENVHRLMEIRYDASRAGPKKLKRTKLLLCDDGTVKGNYLYCGAYATGRFTGVNIQTQNYAKEKFSHQVQVLSDVMTLTTAEFKKKYKRPLDELSKTIRGTLAPPPGMKFIAADYSSIEAVVLAWLAEETWLVNAFANKEDAYVKMAALIYKLEESEIGDSKRFFGKQVVLGAGYNMGAGRFRERCADFGIKINMAEAERIITLYRANVPQIVKLWGRMNNAAIKALRPEARGRWTRVNCVRFAKKGRFLVIELPSKRRLHYIDAKIVENDWGKPCVGFTKYLGTTPVDAQLYGGLIVQNVVQAISRDLLVYGMYNLENSGYDVRLHVHDDIMSMVPENFGSIQEYEEIMCIKPDWGGDIPVRAEGWEANQWRK